MIHLKLNFFHIDPKLQETEFILDTKERTIHMNNKFNPVLKDIILKILSDKYCRQILTTSQTEPKSAINLAVSTGIPISTIYRRLQDLLDAKLLKITGAISTEGKKYFLYQSKIKEIHAAINGSETEIILVMVNNSESNM